MCILFMKNIYEHLSSNERVCRVQLHQQIQELQKENEAIEAQVLSLRTEKIKSEKEAEELCKGLKEQVEISSHQHDELKAKFDQVRYYLKLSLKRFLYILQ